MDAVETVDSENCNSQGNYSIIVEPIILDNDVVDLNNRKCFKCLGIESIILPGKVRTCGRPKGAIMTTIGLPKRLKTGRALAKKTETKTKNGDRDIAVDSDEQTYCLCNQISYGEMICCDNDLCPVEWFHFSCVLLSTKPKGKWFCPKCRGNRPNKILKPKAQFLKKNERYNKEKEDKA
ncbi:unnamed protein product [Macrosiphum euphorbiae]|uniref:PHD-type domain-containing protein n=1 Tax=Macrosiphum euphorbiae TaxID=13131 RepID=A0AAV0W4X6_9HEMI|nr:unnamed protein product [Macrosiphum euphorbiae]CAI6372702.1 unnamed protein product [Macrosiphum euphorbiae]